VSHLTLSEAPGRATVEVVGLFERLPAEGFALMRERFVLYGAFAVACAASAAAVYGHANLLQVFAGGDPSRVLRTAPINVILISAVVAIFFVLPSALRRIQPSFRMTLWRVLLTAGMLLALGLATDLGYAAAVLPGLVLGVLLSQALFTALLRSTETGSFRDAGTTMWAALLGSFRLTRAHFATTFGVCAVSLAILGVPFLIGLIALLVLDALEPRSLIVTAPALFLTFVYFECVRYVLIVRWYGRLASQPG
jgi:hypothetical protein